MKVRSLHSSKPTKQQRIIRVLFLTGTVLLIGVAIPSLFMLAGRVVLYPFHSVNTWLATSEDRFPMYFREQESLVNKITELENELAVAVGTDLTQQRLYEENVWLRGLLAVDQKPRIAAAVVARPNELPYDLLQIDRGAEAGIKVGAAVYIGVDNVIGIVKYVAPHYAFVELFTTPGFTATAYISGTNIVTTLEGFGGGVARVSVPQGIPLQVGNLVHVPSIEPGVFGRVEYLENRPSQPEQYGYITLPESITGIRYVAVASEPVAPATLGAVESNIEEIIKQALIIDTTGITVASTTATTSSDNNATTTP